MKITVKNRLWIYAFLLIGGAYIFGLFVDLTGDSGLYAAIARQMAESGNWMDLKINGELYDQKPHLIFWLAGLGIQIFGNTNFAFKIFPTLWGLAGLVFTYELGKTIFSKRVGKTAALIAGTSQIFMLYFLDIHTDTILQTGVILALWQLILYLKNQKPIHFIIGFLAIGIAMLSKGPVGAIVPFFVVLFFLLAEKKYRQLFHPKWLLGILLILIVISPTLFHLYKSFGWQGIQFYFITNNFGRITGDYAGSSNDYLFYIHTILWAFIPWTVFVLFAVYSEIKSWFRKNSKNNYGFFLLVSVFAFMLILSIAKGKAPNYFFLAVPILSVITAKWISEINELSVKKKKYLFIAQQIIMGVLFLLFIGIVILNHESNFVFSIMLLLILGIAIYYSIKKVENKLDRLILNSILITGTLFFYLNTTIIPELYSYQGAKQALQKFEENKKPGDILYNLHLEEYEMFYYAKEPVIQIHNNQEYREMLEQNNIWIYTTKDGYEGILNNIGKADTVVYVKQRGMNRINFAFLNPNTRNTSLKTNYLIKK